MTCNHLLEIYEAEIRQAFEDMGDDFDLRDEEIDFTDDGSVLYGKVQILPPGTIDPEQLAGYL